MNLKISTVEKRVAMASDVSSLLESDIEALRAICAALLRHLTNHSGEIDAFASKRLIGMVEDVNSKLDEVTCSHCEVGIGVHVHKLDVLCVKCEANRLEEGEL